DVTTIVKGDSRQTLRPYTDRSFDLVYVDGDHEYSGVKADSELAVEMAAEFGFLVFNDYLLFDHNNAPYGIVPVVNDLAVNRGWDVVGFAINHGLYADIALQRTPPNPEPAPADAGQAPAESRHQAATSSLLGRVRALAKTMAGR